MLTREGISTTKKVGSFRTEQFYSKVSEKTLIQWDYRDANGELHTGIAPTLQMARKAAAKFGYGMSHIVGNSQEFPNV
jgi:hypothetical protein